MKSKKLYEKYKKTLFDAQSKEQYEKALASMRELSEHNYLDTAEIVEKVEQALEKHPIIEKEVKFVNKMYPVVFFPDKMFFDKTKFSYNEIESVKIGKFMGSFSLEIKNLSSSVIK